MLEEHFSEDCQFCAIIQGEAEGTIIARDEENQFAIIADAHPEAAVHWLAMPFTHIESTADFEHNNQEQFYDLIEFAIDQTKKHIPDVPLLQSGFTIKLHFGGFETIPHAKLHILSTE